MSVSSRLKKIRDHLALSQSELSEKYGAQYRTYQNYETDKSLPKCELLIALALGGFSIDWLVTGQGGMLNESTDGDFNEELFLIVVDEVCNIIEEKRWDIPARKLGPLFSAAYKYGMGDRRRRAEWTGDGEPPYPPFDFVSLTMLAAK